MTKTLLKSQLVLNKSKIKTKPELNITKSTLHPNLQIFKQKLISGNGFLNTDSFHV